MADWMVSWNALLAVVSWRVLIMDAWRLLRNSWSSEVMCRFSGNGGRFEPTLMADDGDDSASKRAWRTAESLEVRVDIVHHG